jgi:hypothetical protein
MSRELPKFDIKAALFRPEDEIAPAKPAASGGKPAGNKPN